MPFDRSKIGLAALLLAAMTASPALAAETSACPATAQLPPEWAAWATPSPAPADRVLSPNAAYKITLAPVSEIELTGFDGKEYWLYRIGPKDPRMRKLRPRCVPGMRPLPPRR